MLETVIGGLVLCLIYVHAMAVGRAAVMGWVWLYTALLPRGLRERRRAEIRSELWEHIQAARQVGFSPEAIGLQVLTRLAFGIPADVVWAGATMRRWEQGTQDEMEDLLWRLYRVESVFYWGMTIPAAFLALIMASVDVPTWIFIPWPLVGAAALLIQTWRHRVTRRALEGPFARP